MKLIFLLVLSTVGAITISAQTGGIRYEKRTDILNATDCNPSEVYLKKKVKILMIGYEKK